LRELLNDIQDAADEADHPASMTAKLGRMKRHARRIDEPTAQLLLDAIALGEDFASLYIQSFLDFPAKAPACQQRTHSCP
jgi:hypothetical protein